MYFTPLEYLSEFNSQNTIRNGEKHTVTNNNNNTHWFKFVQIKTVFVILKEL